MDPQRSNMAVAAVGRTLVIVHSKDFPSDVEWDGYLDALRTQLAEHADRRSLVVTEGGAPSAKQRERMGQVVGKSVATTAVVSSSRAVQATVGALHLQNPAIKAFAPGDLEAALEHLGLRDNERKQILERLPALKRQLGIAD